MAKAGRRPTAAADDGDAQPDTGTVRRRAPFSDNPTVGRRGQRTQQRILDAAIGVLNDEGYHGCSIDRIANRAGCSRVSFYQYFSSKEDVFQHLAAQVARQVSATVEALDPLTPDVAGWQTLRTWATRYADIYERYGPVFQAFEAAAESAEAVATLRLHAAEHNVARIRSKLATTALPLRELDAVIGLLLDATARAYHLSGLLRGAAPDAYPRERIEDAVADVIHRTLFGLDRSVNVHGSTNKPVPALPFAPAASDVLQRHDEDAELSDVTRGTLNALLAGGRETFAARGYHGTRIDDIVTAAGLSHGAFYRYFDNKAHFAGVLVMQAMQPLSAALSEIPPAGDGGAPTRAALRRWLRRYNDIQVDEAAMIRVWIDAARYEPGLDVDAAAALDWGRRRIARFLQQRGFGDVDGESVVLVALLDAFGARPASATRTDATAHVIERGLLGR